MSCSCSRANIIHSAPVTPASTHCEWCNIATGALEPTLSAVPQPARIVSGPTSCSTPLVPLLIQSRPNPVIQDLCSYAAECLHITQWWGFAVSDPEAELALHLQRVNDATRDCRLHTYSLSNTTPTCSPPAARERSDARQPPRHRRCPFVPRVCQRSVGAVLRATGGKQARVGGAAGTQVRVYMCRPSCSGTPASFQSFVAKKAWQWTMLP